MKPPRGLTPEESEAWARVAATVTPIERRKVPASVADIVRVSPFDQRPTSRTVKAPSGGRKAIPAPQPVKIVARPASRTQPGLDSSWDKKLGRGSVAPDFTLDLHGATLDAAHGRLLRGLAQAKAMSARVVLVITGKPRPAEAADRGSQRGAIRAKIVDWLAASEHALDIAAIRGAHRRHGGPGALYLVLKRRR